MNRRSRGAKQQRGVALILVLTTVAILTAVGVDFSYSSRVSLKLAENMRDETRAYYLARSGVNLSRLLLHFQKQIDQMGGALGNSLQSLLAPKGTAGAPVTGATAAGATAAGAGAASSLGIRLWDIVPIDSNIFTGFLSGDISGIGSKLTAPEDTSQATHAAPTEAPAVGHAFGAFDGSFSTKIVDENSRINVNQLDGLGAVAYNSLIQMSAMMSDPKYNFIFDEEDAQHDKVSRDDVIAAMKDWCDLDESGSGIDRTNRTNPFPNGFSDENSAYDRYTPRYKAKNAHFDSLQELFMVRGVNDRFMEAFGDRLTVWPDINGKLNINTDDPQQMLTNILIAAANPNLPALHDPRLLQTILQEIQLRKMFSFFGLSPNDFVSILQANAIQVRPELDTRAGGNATNLFSASSDTFRITATGRVGRIEKNVVAVIRYDEALGKLIYWKEE